MELGIIKHYIQIWLCVPSILFTSSVIQQTHLIEVENILQEDNNFDGQQDLTIITCSFETERDLIYVYDGESDMKTSNNWREATDFNNDTWIFDAGGDGNAELVIDFFTQESGARGATIYDDIDGDRKVEYVVLGKEILIKEPGQGSIKILSDGDWFLPNGYPNQNLIFNFFDTPQLIFGIVDSDHDGIPDYDFSSLYSNPPKEEVNQFRVWVNKEITNPLFPQDVIFWPFLISADRPKTSNKFEYLPTITVNWDMAKVDARGIWRNASGYPIENGYYVSGFSPLVDGKLNYANFENPMAWYDLAKDHDGIPELHIRLEYFNPNDPDLDISIGDKPFNDIRYSWNQSNRDGLYWDFKVALAGLNEVKSSVWFDTFGLQTVPYEQLPSWVSEQNWEWGTLVADEGGGTPSSEGIYEWSATNIFQADIGNMDTWAKGSQISIREYLAGNSTKQPDIFYQEIRQGKRGEFGYLFDQPNLYFSPIDHKLHLKKSIHGVWNLGDGIEIRYANLNQGDYINRWQLNENGQLVQELITPSGFLILSDVKQNKVSIKELQLPPPIFETLPPRNHAEWRELGRLLDVNQADFKSNDFTAMVEQFGLIDSTIKGATLRDFRLTKQGYRFILKLNNEFHLFGADMMGVIGLTPGEYVVTYDGAFHLQPLTAPEINMQIVQNEGHKFSTLVSSEILIILKNTGLEDAYNLSVSTIMHSPDVKAVSSQEIIVDVLAGEERTVKIPFLPDTSGNWGAEITVTQYYDSIPYWKYRAKQDLIITVDPAAETNLNQDITVFGVIQPWQLIAMLSVLLLTVILSAWILSRQLWLQTKNSPKSSHSDEKL